MIGNIYSNSKMSQEDTVLLHLINNGKINNNECREMYGFKHLPSVIRYLRNRGMKILSEPRCERKESGGHIYSVNYVLAPLKEQTLNVQEIIKRLKNSFGGVNHACIR